MMLTNLLLAFALQAGDAPAADPAASGMPTEVADSEGTFLFPPGVSTLSDQLDKSYFFIHWVNIVFTVLIFGILFFFVIRYHRSKHPNAERTSTHNTPLELLWSVPPAFILAVIFWNGLKDYLDLRTAPRDALEIQVLGQQWSWSFTYPNGAEDNVLYVPVNEPVKLIMRSADVLHSFFVPAFRTKMDVVPGRYTDKWFEATRTGTYAAFCTEYCGSKHSAMLASVVVLERDEWEEKMGKISEYWITDGVAMPPVEVGEIAYVKKGCNQCHSTDGSILQAPSFKGIFGTQEALRDGRTVTVDENYIRSSILEPLKDVVAGFNPVMPPYQGRLKDPEIDGLIAYIKSLK